MSQLFIEFSNLSSRDLFRYFSKVVAGISLLLLAVAWIQADKLTFLYHEETSSPIVNNFLGFSWDTSKESVTRTLDNQGFQRYREEAVELPSGEVGTQLIVEEYPLMGKKADIRFVFSGGDELKKGTFRLPFDPGENCEQSLVRVTRALTQHYQGLRVSQRKSNPTNFSYCRALEMGRAQWTARGREPYWNSLVSLELVDKDDTFKIRVTVTSPKFRRSDSNGFGGLFVGIP